MPRRSSGTARLKSNTFWLRLALLVLPMLMVIFCAANARTQVAMLMEEPYGNFGAMNPTGHAAVFLARVCEDSPTHLRRCRPGELGVVISRYHHVDGYDWIAIPLVPYLYAVDSLNEVPQATDRATEVELRDAWRRKHLEAMVPDLTDGDGTGEMPPGEWYQLIGAAYDRKLYGFQLDSTPAQDDAFIAAWNDRANNSHFNLLFNNCADFARKVLDFYYPHAVRRNWVADAAFTTPKQVARDVVKYGRKHPQLHLGYFIVPQVSGTIERSHKVDGTLEAVVKSKKYVIPLTLINPYVTGTMVVLWAMDGRFTLPSDAPALLQLTPPNADRGRTVLTVRPDTAGKNAALRRSSGTDGPSEKFSGDGY